MFIDAISVYDDSIDEIYFEYCFDQFLTWISVHVDVFLPLGIMFAYAN
jgi:hypothetical protein